MRVAFTFHQALFGYDGGHHLLSASLQMPPEVRHFLAVATDLSGSAPAEGFDTAYTGLPLGETNYYALFCTWLAPEMRRPGCVWSHVLLIELADLAELPDLGALRRAFRRPVSPNLDEYRTKVNFQPQGATPPRLSSAVTADAGKMLAGLYLAPKRPIVFPTNASSKAESLVFALWSQQWPRLRRNFRFSTGSFADRGRSGDSFDLQVSPEVNRRAWQRQGEYLLVDSTTATDAALTGKAPSWMCAALNDLLAPDVGGFRSFLCAYGTDVNDPRSAFARLAFAYDRVVLRPNSDWMETLRSVGETFSDPSEAILLKEWLVSPRELPESEEELKRNLATTSFLLDADGAKPYAGASHGFSRLARGLWPMGEKRVLSMLAELVRQQERPCASAFAAAVASAAQPSDLRVISEERPELIPLFLLHRPELAFHVEAWRLPANTQWRIHEVLDGLSLDAKDWGEIMVAMLVATTRIAVRDVVEKAGPYAIEGAFRWLDNKIAQERLPPDLWREALAPPAADRLQNAELSSPATLALCAWFLRPEVARQVLSASREDVVQLARQPIQELPPPLRLYTAFLLVTLGLRAGDLGGAALVARGFFRVHDALASNDYSSDSWRLLCPELPYLGRWKEWDRCEKLRRAVRMRLSPHIKLISEMLLAAAVSPEHREIVRLIGAGSSPPASDLDASLL